MCMGYTVRIPRLLLHIYPTQSGFRRRLGPNGNDVSQKSSYQKVFFLGRDWCSYGIRPSSLVQVQKLECSMLQR